MHGDSFVAKRDNPGICPGDGWQLLSGPGKRLRESFERYHAEVNK
jgi:hypothetical protein